MVNIAFLIFDITKKNSFLSLNNLINLVRSSGKTDILLILIGNKYDWENQREVNEEEIKNFCKENNILKYYQTSYSNKEEIINFFKEIIFYLIEENNSGINILPKTSILGTGSISNINEEFNNFIEKKKKKKCCC